MALSRCRLWQVVAAGYMSTPPFYCQLFLFSSQVIRVSFTSLAHDESKLLTPLKRYRVARNTLRYGPGIISRWIEAPDMHHVLLRCIGSRAVKSVAVEKIWFHRKFYMSSYSTEVSADHIWYLHIASSTYLHQPSLLSLVLVRLTKLGTMRTSARQSRKHSKYG